MKLGIMQPYFFPYIGYWQLMNAVDTYVIYDDVDFIKGGWINRNRILLNNEPFMINLPMIGASSNKKINEIQVNLDEIQKRKIKTTIYNAYHKAPFFMEIHPILQQIFDYKSKNIADFISNSFYCISKYLGFNTKFILSSDIEKDNNKKGQDKVLCICKLLNATEYYNAIGGQELYSFEEFNKNGIKLSFIKSDEIIYNQYNNNFVSNLSIIDVLMFNAKDKVKDLLTKYTLIREK